MSYILWWGRWGRLMGPGASKWRLRKSNDNCARTRRCYVLSCLELLQHHLWYPQGQGRTNFGVSMSYILRCGRWGRLMQAQELPSGACDNQMAIAPERGVATSSPVWNCCSIIFGTHRDKEEQTLVSPCLTFCGAAVGDV